MKKTGKPARWRYNSYLDDLASDSKLIRGNAFFRRMWTAKHTFGGPLPAGVIKANQRSKEWDDIMSRKTYRIELKMDFSDDTRHEALLMVTKQYTRDLLASAMLLQDGRAPQVALITDDIFEGTEQISVLEESEHVHDPRSP